MWVTCLPWEPGSVAWLLQTCPASHKRKKRRPTGRAVRNPRHKIFKSPNVDDCKYPERICYCLQYYHEWWHLPWKSSPPSHKRHVSIFGPWTLRNGDFESCNSGCSGTCLRKLFSALSYNPHGVGKNRRESLSPANSSVTAWDNSFR